MTARSTRTLGFAAALLLAACTTPETVELETGPIVLTASGPLFEGTNTAQADWSPELEGFLQQHDATPDDLRAARVVSAELYAPEGQSLQGIRSASFLVASDAHDMLQVAVLNPLPAGQDRVQLTTATEQEGLAGHLLQNSITLLADLDLDADSDTDRHVIGRVTLELQLAR